MKKFEKSTILCIMMLITATVLTGCGSSANMTESAASSVYSTDDIYMNEYAMEEEAEEAPAEEIMTDVATEEAQQNTGRKLIKTVSMDVETEEYDSLFAKIEQRITELGGYIENLNEYQDRYGYEENLREASITARIPKEKLDEFVTEVTESSNVINRNERVEDVTLSYVDLESHKKVLITERDRLMELLENAETMEDIIAIEGRLSEVRYQIESMESQLRTYDNKIDYSTVYVNIREVERLTPQIEETAWEKIKTGFGESTYNVLRGIKNTTIQLIISIPYLIVWAIVIVILIIIVKVIIKMQEKKKAKKQIAQQMMHTQMPGVQKEEKNEQ
ncbi:MAG: DUF4349 domain-containing protein [Lachnospiraceae bacterium]|nr:DUF4349 domain-containing protein [Lachnospiraceae bacterium]